MKENPHAHIRNTQLTFNLSAYEEPHAWNHKQPLVVSPSLSFMFSVIFSLHTLWRRKSFHVMWAEVAWGKSRIAGVQSAHSHSGWNIRYVYATVVINCTAGDILYKVLCRSVIVVMRCITCIAPDGGCSTYYTPKNGCTFFRQPRGSAAFSISHSRQQNANYRSFQA